MLIDARPDDGAADIGGNCSAAIQMAQEISKADGTVFDGGASQPWTTLHQVCIDVTNAQSRKALLLGAWPE